MKTTLIIILTALVSLTAGVLLAPHIQALFGADMRVPTDTPMAGSASEREVLYWVAPMDPSFRRDAPGKSPMGMDLVPVYADDPKAGEGIRIDPVVQNNLGVRTALVERGPLWRRIDATGYVSFDENRMSHIHLRTEGWIENLQVRSEGDRVSMGDLLFEFYSPDIVNAQKEYLQAVRRGDAGLRAAAREKLLALGVTPADIGHVEQRGRPLNTIRVLANQDGIVAKLNVQEGMHVMPATVVLSLADLSTVWVHAEVFESQADWVAVGQPGEVALSHLPGQRFEGQVDYIYPVLDPMTRTLKVRLTFANSGEKLKPNMYGAVVLYGGRKADVLSIPAEALIRSGDTDRVVLSLGDGRFTVKEVEAGIESGDWVEITRGLRAGERVVTSGQFLIDSEASLAGSIRRLDADAPGMGPAHD